MKTSKRQLEIEARRAADPVAQALGRTDIDYSTDELPTAPRSILPEIVAANPPDRDVPVSKEFFAQLAEYLLPDERWVDIRTEPNLIIHVKDYVAGHYKKLVFTPKETT